MRAARTITATVLLFTALGGFAVAEDKPAADKPVTYDINTVLMESTFLIYGPKKGVLNTNSFGTAFLMGKPTHDDPTRLYYVLISAGHVFEEIDGEDATLTLREKQSDGNYVAKPWTIKLRDKNGPLYV